MSRDMVSNHAAGVAANDRSTWIAFRLMVLLAGGIAVVLRNLRENG